MLLRASGGSVAAGRRACSSASVASAHLRAARSAAHGLLGAMLGAMLAVPVLSRHASVPQIRGSKPLLGLRDSLPDPWSEAAWDPFFKLRASPICLQTWRVVPP